jgi:hypothetical protein
MGERRVLALSAIRRAWGGKEGGGGVVVNEMRAEKRGNLKRSQPRR